MSLTLKSTNGEINLTPEDGNGVANVTLPRGGFLGDSGYSWVDETANRQLGVTYTNTTSAPIVVKITFQTPNTGGNQGAIAIINGVSAGYIFGVSIQSGSGNAVGTGAMEIQPSATYSMSQAGSAAIIDWFEFKKI